MESDVTPEVELLKFACDGCAASPFTEGKVEGGASSSCELSKRYKTTQIVI